MRRRTLRPVRVPDGGTRWCGQPGIRLPEGYEFALAGTPCEAVYEGCRDELAALLGEPGWRFSDEEAMVITSFRVVAP